MEFKKWLEQSAEPITLRGALKGGLPRHGPAMQNPIARGSHALIQGITSKLRAPDTYAGYYKDPYEKAQRRGWRGGRKKGFYPVNRTVLGKRQVALIGLAPVKDDAGRTMNPYAQAQLAWRDAHRRVADAHSLETALAVKKARDQAFATTPEIDHDWRKAIQLDPEFASYGPEEQRTRVPVIFHINKEVMSQ